MKICISITIHCMFVIAYQCLFFRFEFKEILCCYNTVSDTVFLAGVTNLIFSIANPNMFQFVIIDSNEIFINFNRMLVIFYTSQKSCYKYVTDLVPTLAVFFY